MSSEMAPPAVSWPDVIRATWPWLPDITPFLAGIGVGVGLGSGVGVGWGSGVGVGVGVGVGCGVGTGVAP
jgi:hypothetical protein